MDVTTVGLDVAKQGFQVHGVDAHGQVVVRRQLRRKEVEAYFTKLPACAIGMEACSSSHYWARRLRGLGHTVKLMAPQFVRPYVKTNKNDARDAEAICGAVTRPSMRFVPIKTVEQQMMLALHRARHTDPTTTWRKRVQARRNANIAAVALANKHARIIWVLLARNRDYTPDYVGTSS